MIGEWLRRRPLRAYFALTFGISWAGILIVVMTGGASHLPPQPLELGLLFVSMLLGPSMSGLTMTALLDGGLGLRALWTRLTRWKVGTAWYGVALLTAPLLLITILLTLSARVSAAFAPGFNWPLLGVGLIAGAFEEIGWTGFATPRLLARHGVWLSGASLGFVWALWHVLVAYRYNEGTMGDGWILEFAIVYLATLTPYRVLMTWVYTHTSSLLVAVAMHACYTGALMVLFPATTVAQGLIWQAAFATALWGAAVIVVRNPEGRTSSKAVMDRETQHIR